MSYSFSVRGATKSDASAAIATELVKVVGSQPVHEADKQAAQDTADRFIGLLRDPGDSEQVGVSVSGSLSWREPGVFTVANVSVYASIVPKT